MASITSLSGSSSTSSIYSNANAITGLASGLDTEALIEQAVSSYESKINSIKQDQTMVEWQQEVYREIINKIALFSDKYTSYTSDTNLLSSSFFSKAVNTEILGTYANLASASGKSSSAVSLLGVQQLAKAATYTVGGSADGSFSAAQAVTLSEKTAKSTVTGSLTLKFGSNSLSLNFKEEDLKDEDGNVISDADGLADLINKKLAEENISFTSGDTAKASEYIVAEVQDGQVVLNTTAAAGSSVSISSATGDFANLLMKDDEGNYTTTLNTSEVALTKQVSVADALDGQKLSFTYNGVTKSITLDGSITDSEAFMEDIRSKLETAFGSGITVENTAADGGLQLSFSVADNSTLSVSGSALTTLGFSDSYQTSYVNTNSKLSDLVDTSKLTSSGTNEDGETLYNFVINGVTIGSYTADTSLSTIMADINKNEDAGVNVSYSSLTNKFVFTAEETGEAGKIELGGDLANALFGNDGEFNKGQDAKFAAEVNGETIYLTRSSNTVDLDGLKVTLKGTFGEYGADNKLVDEAAAKKEAVTFNTGADTKKITDAVKSMIEDYNELVKLIKDTYKTQPLKNSSGERYEPLIDDDKADMTESEIKTYEEKAKTGILFGDSDLSAMYSKLVSAISGNVTALEKIGISTVYSDGLTTLKLDEDALADALENDPDSVQEVLSGTDGASGFMGAVDAVMDQYGATSGSVKGVLVQKAGSSLAPTTVNSNTLQNKINEYEELIEKWQDKLADKVDYYTRQFTLLEQLMAEMNSQSSTISGLMGY